MEPLEHVNRLRGPPQIPFGKSLVARHEKYASQEDIELLEVHLLVEPLVGHRDTNVDEPFFGKAHTEELKLIVVRNLNPPVIREPQVVCTTAATGWLLPSTTTRRRSSFIRRWYVLGRRLVVIVNLYPLML